jgi:hypothetical protein
MNSHRSLRRVLAVVLTALATATAGLTLSAPAHASSIVTPGDFTGYGFDQCTAPSQPAMDAWLESSPYWAVGIYISGDSRFCLSQPNLSPQWVDTQLENGWRLLPITLGPQAWCTTRERYLKQVRISPDPTTAYANARRQGRQEASKTVRAAQALGIGQGSTLWYDIEAFDTRGTRCRESALSFLSAWTNRLHRLDYVSGVYSSAASGIRMIDDSQAAEPGRFAMPDQVWIADWNGRADVLSSYVRSTSWMPHRRVHQYRGGHNERHGGVTINIDNNFLDLGKGSQIRREPRHCGGVDINLPVYRAVNRGDRGALVSAAQCLFREQRLYTGRISGYFNAELASTVREYRVAHGMTAHSNLSRKTWMLLLSTGPRPLVKYGAAQPAVRRLQRSLNAAGPAGLAVTGIFEGTTTAAVKAYQADRGLPATGVVSDATWDLIKAGSR